MKSILLPTYIVHILLFSFSIFGCGGSGGGSSSENTVNTAPIAVIQAETSVITGVAVGLDGRQSSDADGDELTYQWETVSLPTYSEVQLIANPGPTPYFIPDFDGTYVFSLVVNDGKVNSNMVTISINSYSSYNLPPLAKTFSASPLSAQPGDAVTFSWQVRDQNNDKIACSLDLTGGGDVVEFDDCIATTMFKHTYATGGNYYPRLTVNDGKGGTTFAETNVNVSSSIQLVIHKPAFYSNPDLVGASLDIIVLVPSATVDVSFILARVDDRETVLIYNPNAIYYRGGTAPGFTGTLELTGLAKGENFLEIIATDIKGINTLAYRRFIYDEKPILIVSSPLPDSVAMPNLSLDITCTDDSGSCDIKVGAYGYTLLASATDKLVQIIDLSAFNGQQIKLIIQGIDSFNQETRVELSIFVESSNNLSLVTSVDGSILDLNEMQILYLINDDDGDSLYVNDWKSDIITPVPVPLGKEIFPNNSFLTPTGAIFTAQDIDGDGLIYRIYDWHSGALIDLGQTNSNGSLTVAGNYSIWSDYNNSLRLRRFSDGSNNIIAIVAGYGSVGSNGIVAYVSSGNIFSYVAGITKQLTNDSHNDSVTTDGDAFLYRRYGPTGPFLSRPNAIVYHNGTTETVLTSFRIINVQIGRDYQINNGWVAYTEVGNLGQLHVWTRTPQGIYQQRTLFGTSSWIDRMGENGDVMLINSGKRYLSLASGELIEKCSSLGKSFRVSGNWYVVMGRSLFQVR